MIQQAQVVIGPSELKSIFAKESEEFMKLDDDLEKQTQKVLNADTKQQALEEALSLEYLILRFRTRINSSLGRIQQLLDSEVSQTVKMSLKLQEANLIKRSSRITELREDLNSLQKLAYSVRNIF